MSTARKTTGGKTISKARALCAAEPLSVAAVRGRFGLSRRTFSRLAGFSERAIADWESGKPVSEPGQRRIRELERLRNRLAEVMPEAAMSSWLDAPNPAFNGLKPVEVIERGEIDRLWEMIYYLESGVAS